MGFDWKVNVLGDPEYFSIYLDRDFAESALDNYENDYARIMNNLGKNILDDHNYDWSEPYRFHDDSMLLTSVHLGNNGKWIATTDIEGRGEITYFAHNIDTAEEVLLLQGLFDQWHKSTSALLEGE